MRIILEGADGTGKTTLARILADKYAVDICHCTQYDPTDYNFYFHSIRKNNVIWDRHTIGELIYPGVFNRIPKIGTEEVRSILYHAKAIGTKIFILTEDIKIIKERLLRRGTEDTRILNNIEWINNEFLNYSRLYDIPAINTSKMTLGEIFKLVEE